MDKNNHSVDAFVYQVEGNETLSMSPLGSLIGVSKDGQICIKPENNIVFTNHYRVIGIGNYEEKYFSDFSLIPPIVTLDDKE